MLQPCQIRLNKHLLQLVIPYNSYNIYNVYTFIKSPCRYKAKIHNLMRLCNMVGTNRGYAKPQLAGV